MTEDPAEAVRRLNVVRDGRIVSARFGVPA
jgi:hypothetical protein